MPFGTIYNLIIGFKIFFFSLAKKKFQFSYNFIPKVL